MEVGGGLGEGGGGAGKAGGPGRREQAGEGRRGGLQGPGSQINLHDCVFNVRAARNTAADGSIRDSTTI